VHTRLLHAPTALKQLTCGFEGLAGLFLVHLVIQVLDGLEAGLHFGDEGLGEFKFHRVVGEWTLLTEFGDRFSVGSRPTRTDIIRTLFLQGTHNCFVDNFF